MRSCERQRVEELPFTGAHSFAGACRRAVACRQAAALQGRGLAVTMQLSVGRRSLACRFSTVLYGVATSASPTPMGFRRLNRTSFRLRRYGSGRTHDLRRPRGFEPVRSNFRWTGALHNRRAISPHEAAFDFFSISVFAVCMAGISRDDCRHSAGARSEATTGNFNLYGTARQKGGNAPGRFFAARAAAAGREIRRP